jgi:hypothetical protein
VTWGDTRAASGEAIRFGVECQPGPVTSEACAGQPGDAQPEVKR